MNVRKNFQRFDESTIADCVGRYFVQNVVAKSFRAKLLIALVS